MKYLVAALGVVVAIELVVAAVWSDWVADELVAASVAVVDESPASDAVVEAEVGDAPPERSSSERDCATRSVG